MGVPESSTGMRRDDLQATKEKVSVDPQAILESLGIDDYQIDHDKKEVYTDEDALDKIAEYMAFKLPDGCTGFQKGGWWWLIK